MRWTNATDLEQASDRLESRSRLPKLVRRLIVRTTSDIRRIDFPADDQIQRTGWDGFLEVGQGNPFVPSGVSCWEMGTGRDISQKATDDYRKRTEATPPTDRQGTTFVFVTSRNWPSKDNWRRQRLQDGWRDILVWDASDLDQWLDLAPAAVDAWLAERIGKRPPGVRSLEDYWHDIRLTGEYPLSPQCFLISRDTAAQTIEEFVANGSGTLAINTSTRADGLDFLAALFTLRPGLLGSAVLVDDRETWLSLSVQSPGMVLVPTHRLSLRADEISNAVRHGHKVILPGGPQLTGEMPKVLLPKPVYWDLGNAMEACGYDSVRADQLARNCCGSTLVLRRLISRVGNQDLPHWSQGDFAATLAPFVLIGGWRHMPTNTPSTNGKCDMLFVEELTGLTTSQIDSLVRKWCHVEDPAFVAFNQHVFVASREEAWLLLAHQLTPEHFQQFENAAELALTENDPAFDLLVDDRWLADLRGKSAAISRTLRQSLIETLAILATRPVDTSLRIGCEPLRTVRRVIERVLPANSNWQRWATLSRHLPLLAEADPDYLLSIMEADLDSDDPQLPYLFQESDNPLLSASPHTGLLWALETLAWSLPHFRRAVLVLAGLAARDPGGKMSNRPAHTLATIFLCWMPQPILSIPERVVVLEALIEKCPIVGWRLLLDIMPHNGPGTSLYLAKPAWRNWADGWTRAAATKDYHEYIDALEKLLAQTAGDCLSRWAELIEESNVLVDRRLEHVRGRLNSLVDCVSDEPGLLDLWNAVRDYLASQNRNLPRWRLPDDARRDFRRFVRLFTPTDLVVRHQWLFNAPHEHPDVPSGCDWKIHQNALAAARHHACREICADGQSADILRLASVVRMPHLVGFTIGKHDLLDRTVLGIPELLTGAAPHETPFAEGFLCGFLNRRGTDRINLLDYSEWSPQQQARLFCLLPFARDTWNMVANCGKETEQHYWKECRAYPEIAAFTSADLIRATLNLVAAARPYHAIGVLHEAHSKGVAIPAEFLLTTLHSGLPLATEMAKEAKEHRYQIQQSVEALRELQVDNAQIAQLEIGYYPLLRGEFFQPQAIYSLIQNNPNWYVDLLEILFRSENDEPERDTSDQAKALAHMAYEILNDFDQIPGCSNGRLVDIGHLRQWLTEVRRLTIERHRLGVCDSQLGNLLARAPADARDSSWPAREIRQIITELDSEKIIRGIYFGIINGRGITSRSPTEGGQQERELTATYRRYAAACQMDAPKIAEMLEHVASNYEHQSTEEDEEALQTAVGR